MKIFLSSESERLADDIITPFRDSINKKIQAMLALTDKDCYGKDVDLLCIITTCVSDEFLQNSGWKERVRYSKKIKLQIYGYELITIGFYLHQKKDNISFILTTLQNRSSV